MQNRSIPDDWFAPCPPCGPVPWPQTAEDAHTVALIYVVTWALGLGFLLWKERDAFRVSLILVRYLFLCCIRSIRTALRRGVEGQDMPETRFCKPRERE